MTLGTVAIPATYDEEHLRNIHRHLFQDVYDWAGEFRTVPMSKPPLSVFADPNRIIDCLNHAAAINDTTQWAAVPADEFAGTYAWANQAHPFREGNGRATKIWLADIAAQSPWQLDYERINADVWNQAAALSGPDHGKFVPDPGTLIPVFAVMTKPRSPARPLAQVSSADQTAAIGRHELGYDDVDEENTVDRRSMPERPRQRYRP